jgi:predicted RecB family endonuclease
LNEGYKAEDFIDKTAFTEDEQAENVEQPSLQSNVEVEQPLTKDDETLLSALETLENVQEATSQETCNEEKQVEELAVSEDAVQTVETKPKSKRGRKQKK